MGACKVCVDVCTKKRAMCSAPPFQPAKVVSSCLAPARPVTHAHIPLNPLTHTVPNTQPHTVPESDICRQRVSIGRNPEVTTVTTRSVLARRKDDRLKEGHGGGQSLTYMGLMSMRTDLPQRRAVASCSSGAGMAPESEVINA